MKNSDPCVDAYIAKSADFAQPILNHLRKLIHSACPETTETIKWGFPHFEYKGNVCHMASFKQHCAFGFWKGTLLNDPHKVLNKIGETGMGQFGKITDLSDLPKDKILIEYIKEAAKLNEEGTKIEKPRQKAAKVTEVPEDLLKAINKNKKSRETFESFSNSHKNEYIEWITEAKREETRKKRIETAVEWLAEGKVKNWKYIEK